MNENRGRYHRKMKEINIKDFFVIIIKRLWIVFLLTTSATLVGYYLDQDTPTPLYQTSTRIIIGAETDMNTLMVMIKDPIIMEKVKEELNLSSTPERIASQVDVARLDDSQVVRISVTDEDPVLAAAIANETAKSFKTEIKRILEVEDVQLLSEARENNQQINIVIKNTKIITFVFGLVVGFGFIFLLESLDDKVRKNQEIEDILGIPVLGVVPKVTMRKLAIKKRERKKEINVRGETVDIK